MRSDWSTKPCSIARGIDAVGDPWVLLILRELLSGVHRFDELRDATGIADNILSLRLRRMADSGLVATRAYHDGRRTRHEYVPTAAAHDALPILHAFSLWSAKHAATVDGEPRRIVIVCRACGADSSSGESCSTCGAVLTTDTTAWVRPTAPDRVPLPLAGPGSQ